MKRVICVVEDEKDLNNLVAQYLRKEGYEVRSYYTYEEASAHVQDDEMCIRDRANMADLEERLADFGFLRVHVSYLVNAKYIVGWFKDEVELSNGDKVPLSRAQKKKILAKQRSKKTI